MSLLLNRFSSQEVAEENRPSNSVREVSIFLSFSFFSQKIALALFITDRKKLTLVLSTFVYSFTFVHHLYNENKLK